MNYSIVRDTLILMLGSTVLAGSCRAAPAADIIQPSMVALKAGQFMMGGGSVPMADGRHQPGDGPVHQVEVKAFRMSKYEITVGQFRQFVKATGYRAADKCWLPANNQWGIAVVEARWDDPRVAPSEFHPVVCVSWNDAQAYAAWLSTQTGQGYRLPTEAEWEYAALADKATAPWNDDPATICRYANLSDRRNKAALKRDHGVADNGKGAQCDDMAEYTTVVGMYQANGFGLYDMAGNVSEWVQDCQHANYVGAPSDGSAWTTECDKSRGDMFVRRGGSFASSPAGLRPTLRAHGGQTNAGSTDGFRLAMDGAPKCEKASACPAGRASADFDAALIEAQRSERIARSAQ